MRPFSTVRTMTLPRLDDARVILDGLDAAQRGCVLRQLLSSLVQPFWGELWSYDDSTASLDVSWVIPSVIP